VAEVLNLLDGVHRTVIVDANILLYAEDEPVPITSPR
jgi:hypothetical protein